MAINERVDLIKQIEEKRESHVIAYLLTEQGRIHQDAVRPMYEHLLLLDNATEKRSRIDLFLYSLGGDVSVPWRVISMMREFCEELCVLVPYRAASAATMIALGADEIVMGRKAELGPIDPTMRRAEAADPNKPPAEISVEDVSSYISFIKNRAGITDQAALGQVVSLLANHLTPLTLGSINRQHSHIRLVAKKLLTSHGDRLEEDRINVIVEALTEKMYSHGHAIGRSEADELGLNVIKAPSDLERLMWQLYLDYEQMMGLGRPLDPVTIVGNLPANQDEHIIQDQWIGCIESSGRTDAYRQKMRIKRKRGLPGQLNVNLNLSAQLPANLNPATLPAQQQQILQQFIQDAQRGLTPGIQQIVQQEINRQMPVVGIEVQAWDGAWREVSPRTAI